MKEEGLELTKLPIHATCDRFIGRFVRGKKCDMEKAYVQLKKCLAWREMYKIDTILDWYRKDYGERAENMDAYYPWQVRSVIMSCVFFQHSRITEWTTMVFQ